MRRSFPPRFNAVGFVASRAFSKYGCKRTATLKESVSFDGVGLHSGKSVQVNIHPISVNNNNPTSSRITNGIVFQTSREIIPASYDCVSSTSFSTTLRGKSDYVQTVEHLLAAFYICKLCLGIVL